MFYGEIRGYIEVEKRQFCLFTEVTWRLKYCSFCCTSLEFVGHLMVMDPDVLFRRLMWNVGTPVKVIIVSRLSLEVKCHHVWGILCSWRAAVVFGLWSSVRFVSEALSFYSSEEHTVLLTFHYRGYRVQNSVLQAWITMFFWVYPVTASTWRPNSISRLENMLLSWVCVGQRSKQGWGTWVALRLMLQLLSCQTFFTLHRSYKVEEY